jgi:hypothetical protein
MKTTAATDNLRVTSDRLSRLGLPPEPAGYVDGANLYQFVDSSPLTSVDPLGTDAGGARQGLDTWQDPVTGETWANTGVEIAMGYIQGDSIWDMIPSHEFIIFDGVGYGLYANSQQGGPPDSCKGAGVISTKSF